MKNIELATKPLSPAALLSAWLISCALHHQWCRSFLEDNFVIRESYKEMAQDWHGAGHPVRPDVPVYGIALSLTADQQEIMGAEPCPNGISMYTIATGTPGACGWGIVAPDWANSTTPYISGTTGTGRIQWLVEDNGTIQISVHRPYEVGRVLSVTLTPPEVVSVDEYVYLVAVTVEGQYYERHARAVIGMLDKMWGASPLVDIGLNAEQRGGYLAPAGDAYTTDYEWFLMSGALPDYESEEEAEVQTRHDAEMESLMARRAERSRYLASVAAAPMLNAIGAMLLEDATSPEAMASIGNG